MLFLVPMLSFGAWYYFHRGIKREKQADIRGWLQVISAASGLGMGIGLLAGRFYMWFQIGQIVLFINSIKLAMQ